MAQITAAFDLEKDDENRTSVPRSLKYSEHLFSTALISDNCFLDETDNGCKDSNSFATKGPILHGKERKRGGGGCM